MTPLLVLLTILAAMGVDAILVARRKRRLPEARPAPVPMRLPEPPQGVFLDPAHTWLRITTDGRLRVGVDDFLTEALGGVTAVTAPRAGTAVSRGEPLVTLSLANGRALTLPSPADGEVVSTNAKVLDDPNALVRDPYGAGWVVSLFTRDHHAAIEPLKIGSAATSFLRKELHRLAEFLSAGNAPALVAADGGTPLRGAVASLDEARLAAFAGEFLAAGR